MNKLYFILLSFLFPVTFSPIMAQVASISSANQLLLNKSYDEAKEAYESLLNQGYESEVLFYNLGIAYYELEAYPRSILYFEKALKINPDSKEIAHNLHLANTKIEQDFIQLEDFFLKRWWNGFSNYLSLRSWTTLTIILLILVLASLYAYFFIKSSFWHTLGMQTIIPFAALFVLSMLAGIARLDHLNSQKTAILLEDEILYQSPNQKSPEIYGLKGGTKLKIIDGLGKWIKIELINKEKGWIIDEHIERI